MLPPIEDALGLLELPSNLSDFALDFAFQNRLPLPVDRKTLTFAKRNPVKIDTARKISRFVAGHLPYAELGETPMTFFNSEFRRLVRRASKYPGNGGLWRVWLWGYSKANATGFPETKAFLQNRSDAEFHLFERCRGSERKFEISAEIYSQETLIDQNQTEAAFQELAKDFDDSVQKISKSTAAFAVRLYLDFYFWVMAYAEKDLIDCYVLETKDNDRILYEEGVFLPIFAIFQEHSPTWFSPPFPQARCSKLRCQPIT